MIETFNAGPGLGKLSDATIVHGDCIEAMRQMPAESVDAIVTDPPYGLGFMGKAWDALPPGEEWAKQCLRVLKPGGHLLAFGGTRTWHRLAVAIEDGGFEIRDSIAWLYGSGFPKSLDVSKAIDKQRKDNPDWRAVGAWLRERRIEAGISTKALCAAIGAHGDTNHGGAVSNWENGFSCPTWLQWWRMRAALNFGSDMDAEVWRLNYRKGTPGAAWQTAPVLRVQEGAMAGWSMDGDTEFVDREIKAANSPEAQQWQGWGTALKPAFEPVVVGRKPIVGTVAANVLAHGTGALNIDGCRIEWQGEADKANGKPASKPKAHSGFESKSFAMGDRSHHDPADTQHAAGRWPANVILDEDQAAALDQQSGVSKSATATVAKPMKRQDNEVYGKGLGSIGPENTYTDTGGASRFFYVAKAPKKERPVVDGVAHPTVKPLALMRWLVRLVTPPGGLVLDPFAGSGTTLEAALLEGFRVTVIENDVEHRYLEMIQQRLARVVS